MIRKIQMNVGSTPIGKAITWSYPSDDGNIYVIPTYKLTVSGTNDAGLPESKDYEVFRFGVQRKDSSSSARVVGLADLQTHTIKKWIPSYEVHSASSPEKGAWQVYDDFLIHDGPDSPMTELYASIGCVEICYGPSGFILFNDFIISLSGSTKKTRDEKLKEIGSSGKMTITYQKATRPPLTLK